MNFEVVEKCDNMHVAVTTENIFKTLIFLYGYKTLVWNIELLYSI